MAEVTINTHIVGSQLRSSPTMSAGKAADPARAAKRPLLTFTVGDIVEKPSHDEMLKWAMQMDGVAKTTNDAAEKIRMSKEQNVLKYAGSLGTDGLRAAAAFRFSEDSGMETAAGDIGVGTGAKGALAAVGSYFQPGDEVIMASPGWPTNFDVFSAGVKIVEVDTQGRGLVSPEQLEAVLKKHPRAKGILINTPNNPTGAAYDAAEREALMGVVKNHAPKDFLMIMDNPYGKIVFEGGPVARSAVEKELFAGGRIAEIRSMSKEYGLAGIRVGYVVSKNKDIIAQVGKWNENKGGLSAAEQNIAQAALMFGDDYIQKNVNDLRAKRDAIVAGLKTLKTATVENPPGAIYVWPDFKALKGKAVPAELTLEGKEGFVINTPADAQRYLIEAANIVAVPGTPFYAPGSPLAADDWHFRLCYSGSQQDISKAIQNLQAAEAKLKDPERFAEPKAANGRG